MTSVEHELSFCSDAAGWMNAELAARPELAFARAKIELSARGSRKRRDLTIIDRDGKPAITGEVKLPYNPDGGSPYNEAVVSDAHNKAARVGAPYFLTWNVNRIVLWRTDDAGKPLFERHIYEDAFTQVRDEADLVEASVQVAIRRGLLRFLERASQAYDGTLPLAKRPLDEFFITVLEAALERPITVTQQAITRDYLNVGTFKARLDQWMRDTQQWYLSDDDLVRRDNLERAAKFSCYVLVNKIVFYQALRKRFSSLPMLRIPARVTALGELQKLFAKYFTRAKAVTRDYETVFDGDFGDTLPFLSDLVVSAWRDLLKSVDQFDFTQINYDIIGPIFERLISPEERHRYGQHYTKPEIVDLINAFCIRQHDAAVLDPACGGGTFVVRAYNRKRYLAHKAGIEVSHEALLGQLYGVDISAYAAHLTTINLATRDLIDERNYPLVAQSDFFDVQRGKALLHVPLTVGEGTKQFRPVLIDTIDAVVGNPPYVRQEEISKPPTTASKSKVRVGTRTLEQIKAEASAYKEKLRGIARAACPSVTFSGRSDLHVYFWPHAKSFLSDDGWFGFLTSSSWLDVEYGFRLQDFILRNYRLVAVIESKVEPWFTGARVTTCATILQRESDPERRDENLVHFVQLRSRLSEMLPSNVTEDRRQQAAEALRDRIESLKMNTTERHWRIRVVRQGDLYQLGCGPQEADSDTEESDDPNASVGRRHSSDGPYQGAKWGLYLRAPEIFFQLQERFGKRFTPLADLADVRFGVKTGCDKFFFVRDITKECLDSVLDPREFQKRFGLQRVQMNQVRIVKAGDGSVHLIETEYLEPEIHSLMELSRISIDDSMLSRCVLLCSDSKSRLRKTHVLKYILWGEKEGFDKTVTVAARAGSRPWYDLTDCVRPQIILPKIQQYRHLVLVNPKLRTCNSSLIALNTTLDVELVAAVLNSTVVGFMKWFYARRLGNEANLQIDVYAAKALPVPDPRKAAPAITNRLRQAFQKMQSRDLPDLDDDLDAPDRRDLDRAVIQMLGERSDAKCDAFLDELYHEVRLMHQDLKDKEHIAMRNRGVTARRSLLSPAQIAQEIWEFIGPSIARRFPEYFLREGEPTDLVDLPEGDCRVVDNSLLGHVAVRIGGHYIELGDPARARLVKMVFDSGRRGPVPIPCDASVCDGISREYMEYREQVEAEFAIQVAQKTANEKLQAKVVASLRHKLSNGVVEDTQHDIE